MLLLLLLSYAWGSNFTVARPILDVYPTSVVHTVDDVASTGPGTRSLWDILWSCYATILACTWASMHPNISYRREGRLSSFIRHSKIMVYAFLVPEVVMVWAMRQRVHASRISKKYKDQVDDPKEWTKTHGFFLQMGGFMLYKNGKPTYTILPPQFDVLLNAGKINFPRIHESDISDRSKGDFLSKGIVLVQTTWFVVQCSARWLQDLGLTQLEVVTFALAVLNGITYALWWDKPLNVKWHVRVDWVSRESDDEMESPPPEVLPPNPQLILRTIGSGAQLHSPAQEFSLLLERNLINRVKVIFRDALSISLELNNFWGRRRRIEIVGFLRSIMHLFGTLLDPIHDMALPNEPTERPDIAPMFYAPRHGDIDDVANFLGILIGTFFGAIHCTAWNFVTPSQTEQRLWRFFAIVVGSIPSSSVGLYFIDNFLRNEHRFPDMISNLPNLIRGAYKHIVTLVLFLMGLIGFFSVVLYIVARIALLVLALISLRALPPNSLSQIDWIAFIPHI